MDKSKKYSLEFLKGFTSLAQKILAFFASFVIFLKDEMFSEVVVKILLITFNDCGDGGDSDWVN